jgi:NADPH:quinone reductase-like Zn-dependent oxidoreductase
MWNLPVVANHRKTGGVGTMKAIRFDHHGEPVKVLAIEERPVPEPVDGEVRVCILAKLIQDIVALMSEGILETSPGPKYSLDEIGAAVTQAESVGRQGKVLLVPGPQGAGL